MEHTQHPFSNIRRNPFDSAQGKRLQSSDEVSQKACRVVIPFVQREPGHRPLVTGNPFADQRGFAKAGRGGDEGEFVTKLKTLIEPFDQVGAWDQVRPQWRDIQFRLQELFWHKDIIREICRKRCFRQ